MNIWIEMQAIGKTETRLKWRGSVASAFTLIELLVVIAFVALFLVGLLTSEALAQTAAAPKASSAPAAASTSHAHWSYEGDHGPNHWAALNPAYAPCEKGKAQSPIDFTKV